MKRITFLAAALTVMYLFAGCGGVGKFAEPIDDGMLIIGSIVAENNGLNDRFESIKEYIEVGVVGLNTVDGETALRPYWAETDADGYYFVCNAPPGKYNIQGIKIWIAGSIQATISSKLEGEGLAFVWHTRDMGSQIVFKAEYFLPEPEGRVYNLNHHSFIIYNNRQVSVRQWYSMDNATLAIGETYNRPNVIEYFRTKFADTGWAPYLNEPYRIKGQKK